MNQRSAVAFVMTTLLLFAATSLFAQPVITGVTPTEGPTSGGTEVTITGTGFDPFFMGAEWLPIVHFGDVIARDAKLVSRTTIIATTPAQRSRSVTVKVSHPTGRTAEGAAFRYVGADRDAVQRFLVPIFVPPTPGAYGSEFRSDLTLTNASRWLARITGVFVFIPPICPTCGDEYMLLPGQSAPASSTVDPGTPGRFFEVTNDAAEHLAANLRVYDTSRSSTNFGTELPVVPEHAFRKVITLTSIPNDPRYRLTLRVYGSEPLTNESVLMTRPLSPELWLQLRSPRHAFDPSYAEMALPILRGSDAPSTYTLRLESFPQPHGLPATPIYAFITVTNNETQHITTITPQPSR